MGTRYILFLEDDEDRMDRFSAAMGSIDTTVKVMVWSSAHVITREVEPCLDDSILISLDHDLYPPLESTEDPGDGLDVAGFLSKHSPVCPVIVHSSNSDRSWSMINELEAGGRETRRLAPIGEDWIENDWRTAVQGLLDRHGYVWMTDAVSWFF